MEYDEHSAMVLKIRIGSRIGKLTMDLKLGELVLIGLIEWETLIFQKKKKKLVGVKKIIFENLC